MKFVLVAIKLFCINEAFAQYLYHFSERDFYNQKDLINPSYVGLIDGSVLNVNMRVLNQALFSDFYNRAFVSTISFNGKFGSKEMNGVGIIIKDYRPKNSIESETGLYTMYSRKFQLRENLIIYPSGSINLKHNYFDVVKLLSQNANIYSDSNQKKVNRYTYSMIFGTIMSINKINIGVSVSNLFRSKMYWISSNNDLPTWYNFSLDYIYQLKKSNSFHFYLKYQNNRYSNNFRIPGDESSSFASYYCNKKWIVGGQIGLHSYYADDFLQILLPKEFGFNLGYKLNQLSEIIVSKKSYLLSSGTVLFSSKLSHINSYEVSFKYKFLSQKAKEEISPVISR